MTGELVLVTGASGHMGFRAVVNALEAGYHVRAAVRNQAKADVILAAPSIKALASGTKLTFVFVPDIIADGAYDETVKDVTDDYERDAIQPAVKGTTGVLKSALKAPTVKRIVITSSIIAVIPWNDFIVEETDQVFTADDRIPDSYPPIVHHFQAYAAAKARALNATDKFMETEKPHFEVSNIMPSFFIGKNELITDAKYILSGTNNVAFAPVLGRKSDFPNPGAMSHVDDVAKVHVLALDPKIKGNQNFGLMSGGVAGNKWADSIEIVKKHFPEAVKDGHLPADGAQPSKRLLIDTSKTEKILGIKQRSYEDAVVSVAEHYLELLEKAGGKVEILANDDL
ncbi:hypothetical protein OEA41_000648 [Lepraria neglecta]|uniref:NAD-dependent epimerase/dehydratase domain-containing protein n=1 Tax=Lepraria neglecta TaxID=209136 RepID=A0AAE0DQ06_9LECA|nr:hypothetical protein OEA41_000648 [Lepraria neglecta]